MTEASSPVSTGSAAAPRLVVHGRYGADVGFELDSGSSLGVYLRRQPGSASHYADNEAVWLVWSDAAGRMQLQVPARVRHCDRVGVRVQFEAGQPPALIEQVLALVPRKTLADGAGPDPAERAVVLVVDARGQSQSMPTDLGPGIVGGRYWRRSALRGHDCSCHRKSLALSAWRHRPGPASSMAASRPTFSSSMPRTKRR